MKKLLLCLLLTGCTGAIHTENDLFNPFNKNQDKYYTHGTAFDYVAEDDSWEKDVFTVGQLIYTPSKKTPQAPLEDLKKDRPYTGWLYGEYRKTLYTDADTADTYGLQLGCRGPCSFAKQSQLTVHKLIGDELPTWDRNFTQKSEPAFLIELERKKNAYVGTLGGLLSYDVGYHGSADVGTLVDYAGLGGLLRLGYNLDTDYPRAITFRLPEKGVGGAGEPTQPAYRAYAVASIEQRFVAYNSLLDGSLFRSERHTVTSEWSVQEGNAGIVLGYGKLKLSYLYVFFSPEWSERRRWTPFGSISFEW